MDLPFISAIYLRNILKYFFGNYSIIRIRIKYQYYKSNDIYNTIISTFVYLLVYDHMHDVITMIDGLFEISYQINRKIRIVKVII